MEKKKSEKKLDPCHMVIHKNQLQKDWEFKYEKLNFKTFKKKILETTFVTWGEEEFLKEDTESTNHKE